MNSDLIRRLLALEAMPPPHELPVIEGYKCIGLGLYVPLPIASADWEAESARWHQEQRDELKAKATS